LLNKSLNEQQSIGGDGGCRRSGDTSTASSDCNRTANKDLSFLKINNQPAVTMAVGGPVALTTAQVQLVVAASKNLKEQQSTSG